MSRLIDADKIPYVNDETYFHEFDYAYRYAIDAVPTIDAVPVVHGRWIDYDEAYSYAEIQCSVCLRIYHGDDLCSVGDNTLLGFPHYCPHCGARMDDNG